MSLQHNLFSACTPLLTDPFTNQAWAFPSAVILPSLVISRGWGAGATVVGYLLIQLDCACCWFMCLILDVPPPSYTRLFQTFAWVRQTVRTQLTKGWVQAHVCLLSLGHSFHIYRGPAAHQELFLQRHRILYSRWLGFAPEPQRPAL